MADGVYLRAPCDFGEEFYRVKVGTTMNRRKYLYIQRCLMTAASCGRAIQDLGKTAFPTREEAQMVMKRMREAGDYVR